MAVGKAFPYSSFITPYGGRSPYANQVGNGNGGGALNPDAGDVLFLSSQSVRSATHIPGIQAEWNGGYDTVLPDNVGTVALETDPAIDLFDIPRTAFSNDQSFVREGDLSIPLNTIGDFTIEFWVRFDTGTYTVAVSPFSQFDPSGGDRSWMFWLDTDADGNEMHFRIHPLKTSTAHTKVQEPAGTPVPREQWIHYALTHEGDDYILFRDGVPGVTVNTTDVPDLVVDWLRIGQVLSGTSYALAGHLGPIRVSQSVFYPAAGFTPPTADFPVPSTALAVDDQPFWWQVKFQSPMTTKVTTTITADVAGGPESGYDAIITDDIGTTAVGTAGETLFGVERMRYSGAAGDENNGQIEETDQYMELRFNGDFTIEMWVWFDDITEPTSVYPLSAYTTSFGARSFQWARRKDSGDATNLRIEFRMWDDGNDGGSQLNIIGPLTPTPKAEWVHICVTCEGDDWRVFMNGVPGATINTTDRPSGAGAQWVRVGDTKASSGAVTGYIGPIRYADAIYYDQAGFTPPIADFPVGTV